MKTANEKICLHLQIILDYLWEDERQDFERCGAEGPHIFLSLLVLRQWLEPHSQSSQE